MGRGAADSGRRPDQLVVTQPANRPRCGARAGGRVRSASWGMERRARFVGFQQRCHVMQSAGPAAL